MEKKAYSMYTKKDLMRIYQEMTSDKSTLAALVEMQTNTGVNEQKAYENASRLIDEAARFTCVKDMAMESPNAVIDEFLRSAKNLQGYDRKAVLHEIDFGLGLYQDPALLEQMKEGATVDELFRAYYAAHGEDPALTEDVLEENIRQKAARFRVSPKVMRAMARKLEKSKDVMFTASVLGQENQRLKCIVAMDQYLRNKDAATIADAVNIACTHVEAEAVADAVSRGQMTAKRAAKILAAICLTALVLGGLALLSSWLVPGALDIVLQNPEWMIAMNEAVKTSLPGGPTLANGMSLMAYGVGSGAVVLMEHAARVSLSLFVGGLGVGAVSDFAAGLIGKLSAKRSFFYGGDSTGVVSGFTAMADCAEAEEAADGDQAPAEAADETELLQAAETTVF